MSGSSFCLFAIATIGASWSSCEPVAREKVAEVPCYNRRMIERTLAIIKPDAVERRLAGSILQRIEERDSRFVPCGV